MVKANFQNRKYEEYCSEGSRLKEVPKLSDEEFKVESWTRSWLQTMRKDLMSQWTSVAQNLPND